MLALRRRRLRNTVAAGSPLSPRYLGVKLRTLLTALAASLFLSARKKSASVGRHQSLKGGPPDMRRNLLFVAIATTYQRTFPRPWWRPVFRMER